MKLNTSASQAKAISGLGGESLVQREARMTAYGRRKSNTVLLNIGKLLGSVVEGRSLAQRLIDGEAIHLEEISHDGVTLPIAPNTYLSMATIHQWGCPACHSAHGSGAAPSRHMDARLLGKNVFYYHAYTQSIRTVSDTCFGSYVKALGFAHNYQADIIDVLAVLREVEAAAAAKIAADAAAAAALIPVVEPTPAIAPEPILPSVTPAVLEVPRSGKPNGKATK